MVIATGVDFLMTHQAPYGIKTIVTNPPFKLADQFIRHGLGLGCKVVVLLRLIYMEGARKSDLIDEHLVRVLVGRERLPMMHREGYEGKKLDKSGVPFAWFVFYPTPHHESCGFIVKRMSWYGHQPKKMIVDDRPTRAQAAIMPLFEGV